MLGEVREGVLGQEGSRLGKRGSHGVWGGQKVISVLLLWSLLRTKGTMIYLSSYMIYSLPFPLRLKVGDAIMQDDAIKESRRCLLRNGSGLGLQE